MSPLFKGSAVLGVASLIVVGCAMDTFAAPVNTSFKDDNFFSCILQNYNNKNETTLTDLTDDQLAEIKSLDCSASEISDATGIEKLTNLEELFLATNSLTEINLTENTALRELDLSENSLTNIDLTNNSELEKLNVLDNQLTYLDVSTNRSLTELKVDSSVTVNGYGSDDQSEPAEEVPPACSSIVWDDEQVNIMKDALDRYGYDTSGFNAEAVKLAALQINMCDGASREEMRGLFNAMGVLGLSDEELDAYAREFTAAYNAAANGASVDDVFGTTDMGTLVPNTGVVTNQEIGSYVVALSMGSVIVVASVLYMTHYGIKRKNNSVNFRR